MNFDPSPELAALQARVRSFVADQIIPFEVDPRCGAHGPDDTLRTELVALARRHELAVAPRRA